MGNSDIEKLKNENPIGEVIQEFGYTLQQGDRFLSGVDELSLKVDAKSNFYFWGEEKGDVIEWLRNRNGWNFKQCVQFLHNRSKLPPALRANLGRETEEAAEDDATHLTEKLNFSDWEVALEMPGKQLVETITSVEGSRGIYVSEEIDLADWRIKQARNLAHDLGGFWEILDGGLSSCIDAAMVFPDKFLPLHADFENEFCSWCFAEFSNNSLKMPSAFTPIELDENFQVVTSVKCAGIYCPECAEKLKRWRKAMGLLMRYFVSKEDE
jgi:Zn-finger protein